MIDIKCTYCGKPIEEITNCENTFEIIHEISDLIDVEDDLNNFDPFEDSVMYYDFFDCPHCGKKNTVRIVFDINITADIRTIKEN